MLTIVTPLEEAVIACELKVPPIVTTHVLTEPLTIVPKLNPAAVPFGGTVTVIPTSSAGLPVVVKVVPEHDAVMFRTLAEILNTVVPDGILAPEILWPAPTRTLLLSKRNTLLPVVVLPTAVKTPTLDIVSDE
jgi:hypothetical protein